MGMNDTIHRFASSDIGIGAFSTGEAVRESSKSEV